MAIKLKKYRRVSTAGTNEELVEAGNRMIDSIIVTNANVSAVFLKIYDKATAPVAGTDTPMLTLRVPGSGLLETGVFSINSRLEVDNGLGIAITGGVGDADVSAAPANDVVVHIQYA